MPSRERKHRRRRSTEEGAARRPALRLVALTAVGLTLMGAAYQGALAGGILPGYGPGDEDDGLTTAETAAIAAGGAAIVVGGLYIDGAFDGGGDDDEGNSAALPAPFEIGRAPECRDLLPALPEGAKVASVRVVPENSQLESGHARCFHLIAKSKQDGKWYDVTHSKDASFTVSGGSALLPVEGTKNVFQLPVTSALAPEGAKVKVKATFRDAAAQAGVQLSPGSALALAR